MTDVVKQIDREIAALESERTKAKADLVAVKERHNRDDKSRVARINQLRRARALLSGERLTAKDPAAKVGPAALEKVERYIEAHGKATQAAISKDTGLSSGHVSYAVDALESRGVLRDTGERVRRSPVIEHVRA